MAGSDYGVRSFVSIGVVYHRTYVLVKKFKSVERSNLGQDSIIAAYNSSFPSRETIHFMLSYVLG